jgi:hypothetical protein
MNAVLPTSIASYLDALRDALQGADAALVQDALYDAEEYLRGELAEHPHEDEGAVIARVAGSYGAPSEVADIYRDTEVRVVRALRTPPVAQRRGALGGFFAVAADARTWGALFYCLLSLATGILYFTIAVTGASLSLGLMVLIIGIPFLLLFLGLTRVLSLVEGRVIEVMLGERMPRRPLYADRDRPFGERIREMMRDPRTWTTLLYMILMLPLGVLYFSIAITLLSTSLGLIAGSVMHVLWELGWLSPFLQREVDFTLPVWTAPLTLVGGVALLFASLHLVRGIGRLHAALAKALLVKG